MENGGDIKMGIEVSRAFSALFEKKIKFAELDLRNGKRDVLKCSRSK